MSSLDYEGIAAQKSYNISRFDLFENNLIFPCFTRGYLVKLELFTLLHWLDLNQDEVPPSIMNLQVKSKLYVYGVVTSKKTDWYIRHKNE